MAGAATRSPTHPHNGIYYAVASNFLPPKAAATAHQRHVCGDNQPTHHISNTHPEHSPPDLHYRTLLFATESVPVPCAAFASCWL